MIGDEDGSELNLRAARKLVDAVPHWHHRFEIYPGLITPGSYDPQFLWGKLGLEDRCRGQRILDLGTSDGFFTRKVASLGGDVVGVDYRSKKSHGFWVMEKLFGREFRYEHVNLFDIDHDSLGKFDIVLFLGVLYHMPDMVRALHKVRSLCASTLLLETHSDNEFRQDVAAARYFKATSLAGDVTNFWSPNPPCVLDMLHDVGFDAIRHETWTDRLFVEAVVSQDPARLYKMDVAYGRL